MNSANKLDYNLRPAKFAERKMLLASLANICQSYHEEFQYIGFGGIAFTDFKLFHQELHLNEMTSIEGGDKITDERVKFNRPFSFINVEFGHSTSVLNRIDLTKKSIVWLDYDNDLEEFMFNDLTLLFSKLPKGSVYIFTCNRQLKDRNTGDIYEVERFKSIFKELTPFNVKMKDFKGENNFKTIRKMVLNKINDVLKSRNVESELVFYPLYNFLYQEIGGAPMFSFGGIIEEPKVDLNKFKIGRFDFIRQDEVPYRINLPILTTKEMHFINENIDDLDVVTETKVLERALIDKYIDIYKYLPKYFDVRT